MKKMMIVLVAFLVALGVNAQHGPKKDKKSPEERIDSKIEKMKEVLAISADQEAQIRPVLKSKQEAMMAFRKVNKGNKELMKAEQKKQKAEVKEQLKKILTPDQQKKWKEHKDAQREERKKMKVSHEEMDNMD